MDELSDFCTEVADQEQDISDDLVADAKSLLAQVNLYIDNQVKVNNYQAETSEAVSESLTNELTK